MKNTGIAFYSFKQSRYLSLNFGGNGDSVEVFCYFSMYVKDKAFKYLKNQSFFLVISSNVLYVPTQWKRR